MKRTTAFVAIVFAAASFCAAQTEQVRYGIFRQEGIASWYGQEFAGRPTASGEVFNPGLLTAAHPTLPFGTMLRVTNRHNNRQVTVRVNDRGPFVPARIVDVSRAAAEQLDMTSTGTAPVLIESINQIVMPERQDPSWYQRQPPQSPAAQSPAAQGRGSAQSSYYDAELGGTVLQPLDGPAPIISRAPAAPPPAAQTYQGGQSYQNYQSWQNPPAGQVQMYQSEGAPPATPYQGMPGPIIVYQSAPQTYSQATPTPPQPAPVYQIPAQPQAYLAPAQAPQQPPYPAPVQAPQPPAYQPPQAQYQPPQAQAYQTQPEAVQQPQYHPAAAQTVQTPQGQTVVVPAAVPAPPPPPPPPPPAAARPAPQTPAPPQASARVPAVVLPAIPPQGSGKTYRIQAGSFRAPRNAVDAFDRLKAAGLSPAYERNGDYYRVVLAGLPPETVPSVAEKLGAAGFREVFIREE